MLDHMSSVHGVEDQSTNDFPQHFMFRDESQPSHSVPLSDGTVLNPELRLNCRFCDEKFTSRSDLKRHISEIHEGNKPQ